jgi:hypothetical protein
MSHRFIARFKAMYVYMALKSGKQLQGEPRHGTGG